MMMIVMKYIVNDQKKFNIYKRISCTFYNIFMSRGEYTVERNTENCNDELINWESRPSRDCYIANGKHKKKSKRTYFLCCERETTNEKD